MIRTVSAQIGLLAFGVAIVAGLYAGNSATATLGRALLAMFGGAAIGHVAAWAARSVLRDYFQRRKHEIDQQHVDAMQALASAYEPDDNEPAQEEAAEARVT